MQIRKSFLCLALALAPGLAAAAPDGSGRDALKRYIDAVGGAAAVDAVHSFAVDGTYRLDSAGLEGTITLRFQRPDKLLFRVEIEGFGKLENGFDGEVAWRLDPRTGPSVLEGEEADATRKWLARGFSLLPSLAAFRSIGPAQSSEHEGAVCTRVTLTLAATGESYSDCFDPQTGLLVGRTETLSTPRGPEEMLGSMAEYRRFGDLLIATRWSHRAGSQTWSATYDKVELNRVDPSVFTPPAEIRALVDAAAEEEAPAALP